MANTSEHLNWRAPHDRSQELPRRLNPAEVRASNQPLAEGTRVKSSPRSHVVLASHLEDVDRTAHLPLRHKQPATAAPGPGEVRARPRGGADVRAFQDRTPNATYSGTMRTEPNSPTPSVLRESDTTVAPAASAAVVPAASAGGSSVSDSHRTPLAPAVTLDSPNGRLAQADTPRFVDAETDPFPEADPDFDDEGFNPFEIAPTRDEVPETFEPPPDLDRLILESASETNLPRKANPSGDWPQPLPPPVDNNNLLKTFNEVKQPTFAVPPEADTSRNQVDNVLNDQLSSFSNQDCNSQFADCRDDFARLGVRQQTNMSIDITPSIQPRELDMANVDEIREEKLAKAPSRTWRNRQGAVLVDGHLTDYRNGKIYVRTLNGTIREFLPRELSDEDWCFFTSWWELPPECRFDDEPFQMRDFRLTTFTWTSPSTCHKPLYFEEVQLERYGHSAGPIVQPFLSGAHFFGSALMLPAKLGLNPPNECEYALGYYRPGDCAPWLVHGYPITTRGVTWQGLALGAAISLFP